MSRNHRLIVNARMFARLDWKSAAITDKEAPTAQRFSKFAVPADNPGVPGRFHGKQVYIWASQGRRPTLCNKRARWPSTADLKLGNVSKLTGTQTIATLTLKPALGQYYNLR